LDIAKNVFQVLGVDRRGETLLCTRLRRSKVAEFVPAPNCVCDWTFSTQDAHYWGGLAQPLG
jgi:hypothetical protein